MKPIILKLNRTGLKSLFCLLIVFSLLFGTVVSPANAKVTGWEVSPESPESGDVLTIIGLASPEEDVEISIAFEKTVPVYLRKYAYDFEKIEILNFNSFVTVRAEGVENIKVKMKMIFSKTESAWADNGIAIVSYSGAPPGEYEVKIEGVAENGASDVNLKVTTVQKLKAGKDGKFSYRYRTESVPSGRFEVKVGDSEKIIIMDSKRSSTRLNTAPLTSIHAQTISGSEDINEDINTSEPAALRSPDSTRTGPADVRLADDELKSNKLKYEELTDAELADAELIYKESEDKGSIHLAGGSWDRDAPTAATGDEILSKGSTKDRETQNHTYRGANFFYLLAGILAGFGVLRAIWRKK